MIYHLASALTAHFSTFNVMHYISFRAIMGLMSTFGLTLALGSRFIDFSRKKFQNSARPFTPQSHQTKGSTPTMGGLFILSVSIANMFLWCDWRKPELWIMTVTLSFFGAIGLLDDLYKAWYKKGIRAGLKLRLQLLCALAVTILWIWLKNPSTVVFAPIFKGIFIDLGYLIIPWVIFVIVGTSNAVNLTDGLDGLAIGTLLLNFSFFACVAYLAGHIEFASYLQIPFADCSELTIIGGILIGACLGFFWFNAYPAQIFMGDVGSLSLGAALAMMAIICKQELLLPIAGGIFVLEALSVIGQIFSIKTFGKKLLSMAPLHHHFELQGWSESKVTLRFHIITLMLCLCASMMLKIR
ncbi:phospho-N-acetylmuramoyl-pentapeptide-transferase [candidate division TM6 bacterium RIFCSPHIGHO2_12_FULL_38_8]|nr:MAG: phospho-N-acetylmuramoyl-pentapeptide-transferase [candidate division TM6 bacterium RIFCSPHIGHO2_12_FULL_38_8]